MTAGDTFAAAFGQSIVAEGGVTNDLFLFGNTDTSGTGRFTVEVLLGGVVFDGVRVSVSASVLEIDAIAAFVVPNPAAAWMACLGLTALPLSRRRGV